MKIQISNKEQNRIKTKYGTANISRDGYFRIISTKEGNYGKHLHRLIFEDFYQIKLPPYIQIHHNDGDKLNNNIWNLIPLSRAEHTRIHNKGKKMSEETCRKMSISTSGENNPNYGKHLSKKTKQKLSEAHMGKLMTEDTKQKIGLSNSKSKNSTGFLNVSMRKVKSCKQGFVWRYMVQSKGKECDFSSVNLNKLKRKVLENGRNWEILDKIKAMKTCDTYGYNLEELC